jgi:hypothetical protein
MKILELQTNKRTINFITTNTRIKKNKKVWDILKNLWLDKIWSWKNTLSINHNTLLYK